tara:strand:- start:9835 stop:10482 length:648 start_codon:yes stop_codon:yes gene_type:complete
MASLNSISESIAIRLKEQLNTPFIESIKNDIIEYRATFIRQDLDRNPLSYGDYILPIVEELELVNQSEAPGLATNSYILRSKNKIAKPLRLKNNGRSNFKSISTVDRNKLLSYINLEEFKYHKELPFQDNAIYYTYLNGYLYVLNTLKPCKILIEGVFADPRQIINCDEPDVFPDDRDLGIPTDMIAGIKTSILNTYRTQPEDGKEINIDKDDNS